MWDSSDSVGWGVSQRAAVEWRTHPRHRMSHLLHQVLTSWHPRPFPPTSPRPPGALSPLPLFPPTSPAL